MDKPQLIVVVGPTAIGKTSLSIRLAQALQTEVISADSRQFFQTIQIGTAKPTNEERAQVKHHFVDFLPLTASYSAGQFERDVISFLNDFYRSHQSAVMVGGSGLYVKAVLEGFDDLPADMELRNALNAQLEKDGLNALVEELLLLDPESQNTVDLQNPQRVVRALEVCKTSGKPYSSFLCTADTTRDFEPLIIGLDGPREWVYDRINQRVDEMMAEGLLAEVESVKEHQGVHALKTVGYNELFDYLDGKCSLEEAVDKIKQHTRNFAKRQWTWFKKQGGVVWMDARDPEAIVNFVLSSTKLPPS